MEQDTPISRDRARSAGVMAALPLIIYYGAAGLAWGLALNQILTWFIISGAMAGLLLGALFVFPVIAKQRSVEKTEDMMFAARATWRTLAILAALMGLVVWAVRLVFF